jgi:hypothetical protein
VTGFGVAAGDVNGDGCNDIIVGADAGFLPQVRVFDGHAAVEGTPTLLRSFNAYGAAFRGGVRVAAGNITGDEIAEIVTATGPGKSQVKVFRGGDFAAIKSFKPLGNRHFRGLYVAVGDFNGDGVRDVVAASDRNWIPTVTVTSGNAILAAGKPAAYQKFLAFKSSVRGGVRLAVKPKVGNTTDAVEQVDIFMTTGPGNGGFGRRARAAAFRGNSLKPAIVNKVFASGFDGIFPG